MRRLQYNVVIVGELLFPTRVAHVSDYTQSGVITRAVHLVGKVGLVGNHQDPKHLLGS
jgi:hypothetical protein